jgi:hypothetical protein
MASSKNIMLDPTGEVGTGETFKLLLGKTGDDMFALHFQEPLEWHRLLASHSRQCILSDAHAHP